MDDPTTPGFAIHAPSSCANSNAANSKLPYYGTHGMGEGSCLTGGTATSAGQTKSQSTYAGGPDSPVMTNSIYHGAPATNVSGGQAFCIKCENNCPADLQYACFGTAAQADDARRGFMEGTFPAAVLKPQETMYRLNMNQ